MKLPLLLTQYLYKHKKIGLPGIGSFTLDPSVIIPDASAKEPHETVQGISFNTMPVYKAEDELIDYIRIHTGKFKPLAEADLESFLALGIQLLNIGKPFYLDGIGAITKSQEGGYEFTPGQYAFIKENQDPETKDRSDKTRSVFEEQHDSYQPQSNTGRKLLVAFVILGGLALAGWGGYSLYKKNTYPGPAVDQVTVEDTVAAKKDTASVAPAKPDTLRNDSPVTTKASAAIEKQVGADSSVYKFIVLSTDNKVRALKRYNQLLSYQLNIKMETRDSAFFKLYFAIPASARDTIRIKDSLNTVYATKVHIER